MIEGRSTFYVGHVGRIPVYASFEAIFIVFFVWSVTPPTGPSGPLLFALSLSGLLTTIVLHELGHAAVALATGMAGVTVTIGAMGGYCSYNGDRRPSRVLPITLAGVVVNFGTWALVEVGRPWLMQVDSLAVRGFFAFLAGWSLALGIFNSLPIYPLDGGQATLLIAQMTARREATARRFVLALSVASAIAALLWFSRGGAPSGWTIIVLVMLLMQAFRDLR